MRAAALLVVALFAFGALAGCVGGSKDAGAATSSNTATTESVSKASTSGGATATSGATTSASLPRLPPLPATVSLSGPQWVAAGTGIPAAATASGASSFVWATGPAPEAAPAKVAGLNTSLIQAGASKSLKFVAAGVYGMHCHPHPYMRHNVTVIDGYQGPSKVTVKIVDGDSQSDSRFVPENIIVGVGTEVAYENVGALPHTSTQATQEPALKIASLKTATGDLPVTGEGWMRVFVAASDSAGRVGFASAPIYVTSELPTTLEESVTGTFSAALPSQIPTDAEPEKKAVTLVLGGTAFLNVTATDAAGLASVKASLVRVSTDAVAVETEPGATGAASGKADAGDYEIVVEHAGGINVEYTVTLTVVYALVPPPLVPPAPAAEDPHAGH